MNILYYSVHHVLEDDEIRLFQSLNYNVVSLGANSRHGALQGFRDSIHFNPAEIHLYEEYERLGGNFFSRQSEGELLPEAFVDLFDFCIVMHDLAFIETNWPRLKRLKVIWRSIGQDVDAYEERLHLLRREGLFIVRYSDIERRITQSAGQDAIIRFGKDEYTYRSWAGEELKILTFASRFQDRYPREAMEYRGIVDGIGSALGGMENQSFSNWIGFVPSREQIALYRSSRAYLYTTGLDIPYTLNFLEAWITGLPVVVFAPRERRGPYFEIPSMIVHGQDGFVFDNLDGVRKCCCMLLSDHAAATAIGAAGRKSAMKLFSLDKARNGWRRLLSSL